MFVLYIKTEKKKVVFMARTGALVKQQVDRISAELKYARVTFTYFSTYITI